MIPRQLDRITKKMLMSTIDTFHETMSIEKIKLF